MRGLARRAIGVAMAGVSVVSAFPSFAQEADPTRITRPIWDRRPSMSDLRQVYPRTLYPDGREGLAAIDCRVNDEGRLGECRIVEESAPGFGEAAARLAPRFRMRPLDQLGQPVAGRVIRVPFRLFRG